MKALVALLFGVSLFLVLYPLVLYPGL
ncbi:MAG: hypothetical protein D084_Lepto4C00094G0001, partial [Leptospirillum sp. Group IV 'UBA BS']